MNPEEVKLTIAKSDWSEGRKENAVWAYLNFATMKGLNFIPPRYKRVQKLPFIPLEEEIDVLIGGLNERTATFCQLIKETGMRPGEVWALKWIDVDFRRNVVNITPEKISNGRTLRISNKLAVMLNEPPRRNDTVFRKTFGNREMEHFRRNFQIRRRRLAEKIKNPRIKKISFLTLRHWKATMEYHRTKDILHVMRMLGHKNIKNTLIYTHLIPDSKEEFICKVAKDIAEAKALIEDGFEYVTDMDGFKLFRKCK